MFGLFRTAAKNRLVPARKHAPVKLMLEALEDRDCPAPIQGPTITSFTATEVSGNTWILSGHVADQSPSSVVVNFGGLSELSGTSTTLDASSNFSYTVTLAPGENGIANAKAVDPIKSSNMMFAWAGPPALTLAISYGSGDSVTLSGQVSDASQAGLTVKFSGAVAGSTTTATNGAFSYTTTTSAAGTIDASVTDNNGLTSNAASVSMLSATPQVTSFQATLVSGLTWTFSGQVVDRNPGSLTVNFGGLTSLSGATASVSANGAFSLTTNLLPGESGYATAQTTDNGQNSNVAAALADVAPSLAVNISYGASKTVTLSGQVTSPAPGGLTITFTGVVSGTVVTNADGTFSIELPASGLGNIEASTTDKWGVASRVVSIAVAPPPPVIGNLTVVQGIDNIFTFSGTVTAPSVANMLVVFSGLTSVQGLTENVQANGSFCLIAQLQLGEEGTVEVETTDCWGQISNIGYYTVRQS